MKIKYKQSLLGPIWLVFQPLAMLVGFTVGFSSVAHIHTQGVPYALFALSGLSVWSYFSAAASSGALSLVGNTNLVRYTACPRLVLTISSLLAAWPALAIPVAAALIGAAVDGYLSANLILAPLVVAWLFILAAAVGGILASLAVRYRDVPAALPFLLSSSVFFAPIAYPVSHLSGVLRGLVTLNPVTGLLDAWRWCLLGTPLGGAAVPIALGVSALVVVLAWLTFGRLEVTMTDDI